MPSRSPYSAILSEAPANHHHCPSNTYLAPAARQELVTGPASLEVCLGAVAKHGAIPAEPWDYERWEETSYQIPGDETTPDRQAVIFSLGSRAVVSVGRCSSEPERLCCTVRGQEDGLTFKMDIDPKFSPVFPFTIAPHIPLDGDPTLYDFSRLLDSGYGISLVATQLEGQKTRVSARTPAPNQGQYYVLL